MGDKQKIIGITPQLSSKISEESPAGFLLFYINSAGSVQVHSNYDCELSALALQSFCTIWTQAISKNQQEYLINMLHHMHNPSAEESPED